MKNNLFFNNITLAVKNHKIALWLIGLDSGAGFEPASLLGTRL